MRNRLDKQNKTDVRTTLGWSGDNITDEYRKQHTYGVNGTEHWRGLSLGISRHAVRCWSQPNS